MVDGKIEKLRKYYYKLQSGRVVDSDIYSSVLGRHPTARYSLVPSITKNYKKVVARPREGLYLMPVVELARNLSHQGVYYI